MKKVSRKDIALAITVILIVLGFFSLVVLPVVYTGCEMILTHLELQDYNLNQYSSSSGLMYGELKEDLHHT